MSREKGMSRRERQIMDIVYQRESATASEVRELLPSPPSYSAVRTLLRVLEEKEHLEHRADGQRYVYYPVVKRKQASRSALKHVVHTFFEGSVEQLVSTLLDVSRNDLDEETYRRLSDLIEEARREEK